MSPKTGAVVSTPDGEGTVINVSLLRGKIMVRFDNDGTVNMEEYNVSELKTVEDGKTESEDEYMTEEEKKLIESLEDEPEEKKDIKNHGREKNRAQKLKQKPFKKNEQANEKKDEKKDDKRKPVKSFRKRRPKKGAEDNN